MPAIPGFPPAPPAFVPPMMPATPFIQPPSLPPGPGIMPPQFTIPPPGFGFPMGAPDPSVIGNLFFYHCFISDIELYFQYRLKKLFASFISVEIS